MDKEVVIAYFSPFTYLPFMIETENRKYIIEVIKIIKTDEEEPK